METYRVFLSSPADVGIERDRAELIIKKLNAERIDHPQLELVRWELEYYRADSQLPRSNPQAVRMSARCMHLLEADRQRPA